MIQLHQTHLRTSFRSAQIDKNACQNMLGLDQLALSCLHKDSVKLLFAASAALPHDPDATDPPAHIMQVSPGLSCAPDLQLTLS